MMMSSINWGDKWAVVEEADFKIGHKYIGVLPCLCSSEMTCFLKAYGVSKSESYLVEFRNKYNAIIRDNFPDGL